VRRRFTKSPRSEPITGGGPRRRAEIVKKREVWSVSEGGTSGSSRYGHIPANPRAANGHERVGGFETQAGSLRRVVMNAVYDVLFALAFEISKLVGDGLWPLIPTV
jgi:hypothetical protein